MVVKAATISGQLVTGTALISPSERSCFIELFGFLEVAVMVL